MKTDEALGMAAPITRRDLLQGAAALALTLPGAAGTEARAAAARATTDRGRYPPVRTGLRGAHPGSFEVAHALAREGAAFPAARDTGERYDLVVVGAGISGLATAHYYRERFGPRARILLLDNHDDFGGHAKRNEFHQGGPMRLSLGGTHNLEWWQFSDTVRAFLAAHGVDVDAMRAQQQFAYGRQAPNSPATWFDEARYGVNRLVTGCDLASSVGPPPATIDQLPISAAARAQLKAFYRRRDNVIAGMNAAAAQAYLRSLPYPEFLRRHGGLGDEAVQLFAKLAHGSWGLELRALSARECIEDGLPGRHLLGEDPDDGGWDYPVALWPDGNASLARLQVAALIPAAAPGTHAGNVATARFDYGALDRAGADVRLRLEATAIRAANGDEGVAVDYVHGGDVLQVRAKHAVLACNHSIIPKLCPTLPAAQREALAYPEKHPLVLTNVLLRNTHALDRLGIDAVRCPGRLHASLFTFRGINTGGYRHAIDDDGPVSLVFWGSISPPPDAGHVRDQLRASKHAMLSLRFEDYEREVRTVLDGLLGPAGFDVARDVLAITVNRWPHGYAYEYLDLWDPPWAPGEAPNERARRRHGRIAIANADAGASAYTHVAIDQAFRAVGELPASQARTAGQRGNALTGTSR